MNRPKIFSFFMFFVAWGALLPLHAQKYISAIDGLVIHHSPKSTNVYLGSPSIDMLPGGDYLLSLDEFGKGKKHFDGIPLYISHDKGATWEMLSVISPGARWSKMFVHAGNIYLIGPAKHGKGMAVHKSEDSGKTWRFNKIFDDIDFHTAPTPVVVSGGRIWKGVEVVDRSLPQRWPKQYCASMLSAPVDADLLDEGNWTVAGYMQPDFTWLGGTFGGWLEGNAVPDREGNMKLIMRVELPRGTEREYIAVLSVSADGRNLNFNPETDFHLMPGGAKKFTIKYDKKSKRYWTLANEIVYIPKNKYPGEIRNVLSLVSSEDLKDWTVHKRVIRTDDFEYTGFQYVDWTIDGNDIIFASRTSYYDEEGCAHSHHDSNYVTFHRIKKFRKYKSVEL